MLWWGGGGVDDVLLLRCILCVPMSTIDGYWLSFGTPTVARGAAYGLWCSYNHQGVL